MNIYQISIILLFLIAACTPNSDENLIITDEEVLSSLENKNWQFEDESCKENSFQFVIHNLKSFDLIYHKPIVFANEPNDLFKYTIIEINENIISAQMEDEYRVGSQNNLIGWDIIIEDDNTFYWRITNTNQSYGPVIVCD